MCKIALDFVTDLFLQDYFFRNDNTAINMYKH